MSDVNWEYIIDTIKSEKCILMLGPEVPVSNTGEPLHTALESYLGVTDDPEILYFNEDEFFFFKDETAKFPTYHNIQKFYSQTQPSEIYNKIAQIPFHLIVSISPDLLLKKVFEKFQLRHDFDYYKKYENPQPVKKPSKDDPLIYNLFGSVEDDESIIFTHEDMFEFLFAISGDYELPNEIKSELRTAKNYIFLGFTFEKWYVKLILRLFNLHTGRFLRYASKSVQADISSNLRQLYEQHFKINFVDNGINDFVDEIYNRCDTEGILRSLDEGAADLSFTDTMRSHITNGDVDVAIKEMIDFLEEKDEDLLNEVSLISSSFRRLKRRMGKGTISEENAELKANQINNSLLELLDEIKDLEVAA